ncbi:hypothetical protein D3C87_1812360 [compost metagenome]
MEKMKPGNEKIKLEKIGEGRIERITELGGVFDTFDHDEQKPEGRGQAKWNPRC